MYICTQLIPLAIKQPFHESTTGQVGTDSHLRHDLRMPLQCKGFLSGLTGLTTQQASRVETWNPLTE